MTAKAKAKKSKPVWRSGPPPSLGWWPASLSRDVNVLRWWNGRTWSDGVSIVHSAEVAGAMACREIFSRLRIEWTDRPSDWPERSRT